MSHDLYPNVDPKQDFTKLESEMLETWESLQLFQKSLNRAKKTGRVYSFYDGPPFANGLPHYGHLLTGYVKDLIPRYQTMKGNFVKRQFGWDCHGLPAEMDAQKGLGIAGRKEILEFGVDKFNDYCRTAIQKYTSEWKSYVSRQGRWVDFEHSYRTMDTGYMESVLWAFSELFKKGLIYEGNRVMPYSWALETPLSNFETRIDNSYRMRQDPAVSVLFELLPLEDQVPTKLIAWTTTPWTLPSNLGLAVGGDIEYYVVEKDAVRYIIGKVAYDKFAEYFNGGKVVSTLRGRDLEFRGYKPIFPFFKNTPNAFRVFVGDFVSTDDGTGVVHLAPGFGEEDQILCEKHGIEPVCPIDSRARFLEGMGEYSGVQVFDANKLVIRDLKTRNLLVKHETISHNYPHCWRTDTPLIYRVQKSWYVKVTAIKDRMVEVNNGINWIPSHIGSGLFGNWIAGARDWSISRNRFWGTPIPVWKSDNPAYPRVDVYGSFEELKRDFGVDLKDLHKPYIDNLVRPNPDDPTGVSKMRRIEDVFDCWFESGAMPFAHIHYPFENKGLFEKNFPADFVVEYVAQTRGWFYTMLVLSTALFNREPFKNAICHGVIVDEDGEKLSKSKGNFPDPLKVFDSFGSDTLRWYLMSSPLMRGGDLQIDRDGSGIKEAARKMVIPLWNAYSFFCLYANADGIVVESSFNSVNQLDRYIIAKTSELVASVTSALDRYDIPGACEKFESYIDVLNNWYIRRSRERFWRIDTDADKIEAYSTLHAVLSTVSRAAAPFLPFLTEAIYRGLTKEESVHLTCYPEAGALPFDSALVQNMDSVIEVCGAALSLRKQYGIRIRQPLSLLTIYHPDVGMMSEFSKIIESEVNVKRVEFTADLSAIGRAEISIDFKVLGPKLGQGLKQVATDVKNGKWDLDESGQLVVGSFVLEKGEFSIRLVPSEGLSGKSLPNMNGMVVLDTEVTDELKNEGVVRDFVRLVQTARKTAGFHVADRIVVKIETDSRLYNLLIEHADYIKAQILAIDLSDSASITDFEFKVSDRIDETDIVIGLRKYR